MQQKIEHYCNSLKRLGRNEGINNKLENRTMVGLLQQKEQYIMGLKSTVLIISIAICLSGKP